MPHIVVVEVKELGPEMLSVEGYLRYLRSLGEKGTKNEYSANTTNLPSDAGAVLRRVPTRVQAGVLG